MDAQRRSADAPADDRSPHADPALRLAARIIDGLAPFAPLIALGAVGVAAGSPAILRAGLAGTIAAALALLGLNAWWIHRYGQTLGKRLLGLRIVQAGGSRATFGRIFWRRIVLTGVIEAVPLLGWIFALVDPLFVFSATRQTLHDRIAGTIVVDLRRNVRFDADAVAEDLR